MKYTKKLFTSLQNAFSSSSSSKQENTNVNTLFYGEVDHEYTILAIDAKHDEEMVKFLFSLGCYEGQKVTIISKLKNNLVISIKDARYSIDSDLANAIII